MTNEYTYLKTRLDSIKQTFDNLISPDPLDQDIETIQNLIKSYILLCHAEFEKYFEDLALKIVNIAKQKYDNNKEPTIPLLHLVLMLQKNFNNEPADKRIDKLYANYHALIKANNGIKQKNLNDIFAPLGLSTSNMSTTYVESLDSFGKKRGDIAHNDTNSIQTIYNYNAEKNTIERIFLETLIEIDNKLEIFLQREEHD